MSRVPNICNDCAHNITGLDGDPYCTEIKLSHPFIKACPFFEENPHGMGKRIKAYEARKKNEITFEDIMQILEEIKKDLEDFANTTVSLDEGGLNEQEIQD